MIGGGAVCESLYLILGSSENVTVTPMMFVHGEITPRVSNRNLTERLVVEVHATSTLSPTGTMQTFPG